jgi:hypothetical protein
MKTTKDLYRTCLIFIYVHIFKYSKNQTIRKNYYFLIKCQI